LTLFDCRRKPSDLQPIIEDKVSKHTKEEDSDQDTLKANSEKENKEVKELKKREEKVNTKEEKQV